LDSTRCNGNIGRCNGKIWEVQREENEDLYEVEREENEDLYEGLQ
jgi:hypothetical protein